MPYVFISLLWLRSKNKYLFRIFFGHCGWDGFSHGRLHIVRKPKKKTIGSGNFFFNVLFTIKIFVVQNFYPVFWRFYVFYLEHCRRNACEFDFSALLAIFSIRLFVWSCITSLFFCMINVFFPQYFNAFILFQLKPSLALCYFFFSVFYANALFAELMHSFQRNINAYFLCFRLILYAW